MNESILIKICGELSKHAQKVSQGDLENLVSKIIGAKRIYLAGIGRSGFMIRAFANRLMHLGLDVYVVGETTTPSIQKGDLLIIGSGSGETSSLVSIAHKAFHSGASIALVTMCPDSTLSKIAETVTVLPGYTFKSGKVMDRTSIQPGGSLFEQLSLLAYDSIIFIAKDKLGISDQYMYDIHANLE